MRRFLLALALLISPALAAAEIQVQAPWIAEAPPGAPVMGGFMRLVNGDSQPNALVGVTSPAFDHVELHRTVHADGVAKMEAQDRIEIPAGGEVALEPGSYHLMLMQPVKQPALGERVPLTLEFADGSTQTLQVPVRKRPAGGHGHHHHHH